MIRVLRNWDEVGHAMLSVQRRGLPVHESVQKNWDHWQLLEAMAGLAKDEPILDLGCGSGFTLQMLASAGYTNLDGIDAHLSMRVRAIRWKWRLRNKTSRQPFRLFRGDFTQMQFEPASYSVVFSVSVIEHGVRLAPFLEECHRVLQPNGLLFVTADYWDPKIQTHSIDQAFGRAWHIFSKEEIERFLFVAGKVGFNLVARDPISSCAEPMVHWQNKDYTAISLLLRKAQS